MNKLFLDPYQKICSHVDFLFGKGTSEVLSPPFEIEYSRKTGKIKNFSIDNKLIGTFRTDGGIAITIDGARLFIENKSFISNCVVPMDEAVPFVSEGRSLFVKHVLTCGNNVKNGSDVAVIDKNQNILAVGRSLFHHSYYSNFSSSTTSSSSSESHMSANANRSNIRGVGVKIREGIKSRTP